MNYQNEREIDLLDLFFYVLEKWKLYILAGIIGLLVCTGYKYYTSEQGRAKNEQLIAEGREDEVINPSDYQSALDALQEQERKIRELEEEVTQKKVDITGYKTEISNNNDKITTCNESIALRETEKAEVQRKMEELKVYMSNSVLLGIDATAKPVSKRSFQVVYAGEGAESMFRDPVDEILAAYIQNISLIDAGSGLTEKYGVEEKYLDELYKVWYDEISNTIFVETTGVDRIMAEDVREAVCKLIEDKKQGMANRYHAHVLKTISESYAKVVDESLSNTQSSRYNALNSYNSQIAGYDADILNTNTSINNLKAANEALDQQISDANNSIQELNEDIQKVRKKIIEDKLEEKVEAKKPSKMRSLKDGIKSGIIGGIVLAILLAVVYCVIYVMDGKLHTAGDMFFGGQLPLLAVLCRPEVKGCFIDKWFWQMRNKGWEVPNEEVLKKAAVSIAKLVGDEKKIALLSTLNAEALEQLVNDLKALLPSVEFVAVSDSFSSAASAEALNGVDGVILYEKRETSKLQQIIAELGQAQLLEKKVFGSIVA